MSAAAQVTCARCGAARSDDPPAQALAWVSQVEAGRASWLCPRCAREHVRDLEGKLPEEYW